MLRLINCDLRGFRENIRGKKLLLWGGGNRAELCYRDWDIKDNIVAIVDANEKMWNKGWRIDNAILCIKKETFISDICANGVDDYVLLITSVFYAMDIIDELDTIECLNGLETYVASLITEYYTPQEFGFTKGNQKIPKKIHYCWFGKKEIPDKFKNYIQTWKKFCPDYEIIRWDESNYDVKKNPYMYEAYSVGKYGFVPDYARLDIIYNYGGIYLDTDIELCKSLDDLLCDESFFSIDFEGCVNTGSGFGAKRHNFIIEAMVGAYANEHFIYEDGSLNLKPCHHYQNPILQKYGFILTQKYQKKNCNVLYPCEVLAPIATFSGAKRKTEKTHSIHHTELSWASESERKARERFRNSIMNRMNVNFK